MPYLLTAIILLLFLLQPTVLHADTFQPVLTNYTSLQYRAGLQNWSIAQDADGLIYVGNNMGVLTFDGYNWQLTPLPGNGVARSLFWDGKRMYVGSYEEFGYLSRNHFGKLEYHSLWSLVKGYQPHNDQIWNIVRTRDGRILFQSFCSWFEYDGQKVTVHYDPSRLPLYFFSFHGEIYSQLINGDFCKVSSSGYQSVVRRGELGDDVVSLVSLDNKTMLLCTERKGLYLYSSGSKPVRWTTSVDNELQRLLINRADITSDGQTIVIGTILGGIIALDRQGNVKWRYDTGSQLVNNAILALHVDKDNNVWAGSDTGLSLIHSGAPFSLLKPTSPPLGMIYDVLYRHQSLYIATNQRTFIYNGSRLLPIAGTEEQNWHVTEFGNQIVVGNNHGAMKVEGMRAVLLNSNHLPSSTCMRRYTVNADEDYLIESTYSDLYVYKHVDGEWRLQNTLQGFSAPVIQFEIDKDGVIWAAHMSKGVYRIELSSDFRRIVSMHYYPSLTSKNNGSLIHVMKIRGNIVLAEGDKLYRPGTSGEFEPYHKLDHLIQDNVISSTPVDNLHFWLTTRSGYILVERRGENYHEIENVPAGFFGLECSDVSNNVKVFNGCSYFCLNGGVGRLDHRKLITASRSLRSRLKLVSAEYVTAEGIHHSLPLDSGVARAKGDVNIRLIYPNYSLRAVTFRFGLEGGGLNIHSSSALPQISFNSLNYGRYLFTAEVVDGNGQVLDRLTYRFVYARPLLLSIPALILYFILIVLGVYYVTSYFLRREKLREQRKMEEERIKQELVVERQQRIIEEQQQQLLEQQLKDKGKEIASLAMDGIMHKQKMKDIKQELQRQKKMSPQEIGKMLQALDDHKDNGDFWDIYKENFDLIHKNFFRNLRKSYPQLTTTDLKFCALFRLNLSTKEVANFTGLTVRGVEGARYRLRRKLNVPKDQSLTQFLIDFQ